MIYIVILLLMLAGVYAYDYRGYRLSYNVAYWAFWVVLVVVAGLRYRIGTDSIVYENFYEEVPSFAELFNFKFDKFRFEPGFIVFASITRSFSNDFMWLQFLHAFVVNLVIFWFISKYTTHRFLCLTFYFIILYLNLNTQVMREALAVCCFLLAWPSFRDGKWWFYYPIILLATTFHTSALFLMLIPLFCLPGIRKLFIIGKRTIIISIGILAVGIYIQQNFSSVFMLMSVTERMVDRVNVYQRNEYGTGMLNIVGMIGTIVQYCLYPAIAIYFLQKDNNLKLGELKKKILFSAKGNEEPEKDSEELDAKKQYKKDKREFNRWEIMVVLGIYFMLLSLPMFIFRRYFNYFGIFCLATVATWTFSRIPIGKKKIKLKPSYWAIILLPFFFYNLYAYAAPASKGGAMKYYQIYYPYNTRLDPHMDSQREAIYRYLGIR